MGNYDSIQVPVKGQPISSGGFGGPVRDAIVDMDMRVALLEASLILPEAVRGAGSNVNNVTAAVNTWQTLTASVWPTMQMTNPSDTFDLVCLVQYGAWMICSSGSVRFGVLLTGGLSGGPDPGNPGPAGWGMVPLESSGTTFSSQHHASFSIVIPAGAAPVTFTPQGQRSSSSAGTYGVNYPSIEIMPVRFQPHA